MNKADNSISNKGAFALSEALKINTTLASLGLGGEQQQNDTKHGNDIKSNERNSQPNQR